MQRSLSLRLSALAFAAAAATPAAAAAQSAPATPASSTFDFTIANMMRGPEVYGRAPERVRWSPDGKWIYFYWNEPGADWREPLHPYRVAARAGATPARLSDAAMDSVAPLLADGDETPDGRWRAVSSDGDLYVVDRRAGTARRLTQTMARESAPRFDATGHRVFFVRDDNVYAVDLQTGLEQQLTNIHTGPAPHEDSAKGQRAFLEAQQRELFEVIRDRDHADSLQKAERARRDSAWAKPLYLEKGERVASLDVSPTGRALLVTTRIPAGDKARIVDVPQWITKSGYTEESKNREKVGDAQDGGRVAFVSLPSGEAHWLSVIPGDSAHAPAVASVVGWNDAGTEALLFAVPSNWKARYLETVGADSGRIRVLDTLRDTAWVDGPCFGCAGWIDGGTRAWFVSEADGWAHLYTIGLTPDARAQQLTHGQWEVQDVALSPDRRTFYLHTSEPSPFERQLYRLPVDGGTLQRITTRPGGHSAVLSPDGTMLADVYSEANRPPELFLVANRPGAPMAQLTTSPTAAWLSFPWIKPQIVMIPASDGVKVPARIYRPQDVGARPNGAAVIFVHGAGYLHNVVDYWSDYPREYMFNHYLAAHGYVVLDEDYRGSAGYGRDWRTAIYRHMGGRDLQDEVDASTWLTKTYGIPPERVGIYGGSYGGFMTLMALFTAPEHFGAGAALRSVTDWAHYNHWYTSRILNQPQDDSVAYRQSSPIYFASGLKDPLLMAHGMVDDNVNFSDIVRLTQRLIELGKTGWELAPYPVERHGFVRPSSWTDEYSRIFGLFERTIGAPGVEAAGERRGSR